MATAVCISGTDDNYESESFRYNLTKDLPDVVFFQSDDNNFDSSLFNLANQKQSYELNNKQEFKLVIHFKRGISGAPFKRGSFSNSVIFKQLQSNTLYSINKYVDDIPEVAFYHLTQYYINTSFFYCDSKTFNIVSTFYKFKNMINGEVPIPEKSKFYSFLLNMGIIVDDI